MPEDTQRRLSLITARDSQHEALNPGSRPSFHALLHSCLHWLTCPDAGLRGSAAPSVSSPVLITGAQSPQGR